MRSASDPVLISRARVVRDACTSVLRELDGTRQEMFAGHPVNRVPLPRRTALDRNFIQLRASLTQCSTEFTEMSNPGKAQQIRDAGASRILPTQDAIQSFETAGTAYMLGMGVKVRPYGAGDSPLASGSPQTH
ncbi:MAG: hypothetical protein ABI613_02265 [Gemmatimonadota bacterium]